VKRLLGAVEGGSVLQDGAAAATIHVDGHGAVKAFAVRGWSSLLGAEGAPSASLSLDIDV